MQTADSSYGSAELAELRAIRERQQNSLLLIDREIQKLKKKFKSGRYDRQIVCEYILSAIRRKDDLIASIGQIDTAIEGKLSPVLI